MVKKDLTERYEGFRAFTQDFQRLKKGQKTENPAQKADRIAYLLHNWEAFMRYYFPKYTSADFAPFHRRLAQDFIGNKRIIMSRAFAREHGKSTFMVMLLIYAAIKGLIKNHLHVSRTEDNATRLLAPIRKNFESNHLLISDFGEFQTLTNKWTDSEFVVAIKQDNNQQSTINNISFRSLGMGQNPRGSQNDTERVDSICLDDADDDEVCRNKARLDFAWEWVMGALYPTMSIEHGGRMVFVNNKIAVDCIIERASKIADSHEQINIYDDRGEPSWIERYTKDQCQAMIEKMGTMLAQREYFNNPQTQGTVFKAEWIRDKPMNPQDYRHLVAYLDPSFSSKKTADHKALVLLGAKGNEFHLLKCYCAIGTVNEMIEWHYDLEAWLKQHNQVCEFYMEEVFLQSLLYKDFADFGKSKGYTLPIKGDLRKKPDKDARITAISGYFERGQFYFNENEKDNHHTIKLKDQFTLFKQGQTGIAKDGCDAVEGGLYILKQRIITSDPALIGQRAKNNKRI
jgi:hypothetical protein